jgi:hypothetical protein
MADPSKFRAIRAVTWTVPDLDASVEAFERWLRQRRLDHGIVSEDLADRWQAPACAGARFCVLGPASGAPVQLRLVESEPTPGWAPLRTFGWNAAELHVQDVHGLARQLADSPFEIIGPPRDLLDNGAVTAMQVLGPGRELLYLTQIDHAGMQATYGKAACAVDRVFIAVLGVANPTATIEHYRPWATRVTRRRSFPITVLARAHGLDPAIARFDITSLVMAERFRIETDAYPESAVKRPVRTGHLPPGLALLTVEVDHLPEEGQRMLRGPDGEWLELVLPGEPG